MNISRKIFLSFFIITLIISIIQFFSISLIIEAITGDSDESTAELIFLSEIKNLSNDLVSEIEKNIYPPRDSSIIIDLQTQLDEKLIEWTNFEQKDDDLEEEESAADEMEFLNVFKELKKNLDKKINPLFSSINEIEASELILLKEDVAFLDFEIRNSLQLRHFSEVIEFEEASANAKSQEIKYIHFMISTIIVLVLLLALWISRIIVFPLQRIEKCTKELGKGNFIEVRELKRNDELGKLTRTFNIMIKELKKLIGTQKKQYNELMIQQREIISNKNEIELQRDQVVFQKQEITNSINYAKVIQSAILPEEKEISNALPEHFILYKPRDIVSGDFYWFKQLKDQVVIVAADCTGHGVPGAFMSMLGISFLNEIVSKTSLDSSGEILNRLRQKVKTALKQRGNVGESRDGMDIALCIIDMEYNVLQYAGAFNPLFLLRQNNEHVEMMEFKANRQPIGIHIEEKDFKTHEIQLQKNDTLYIFSDGYADQFGGKGGAKFMLSRFKKLLLSINDKSLREQKKILNKTIEDWMLNPADLNSSNMQLDDILVIGVRV